MLAYVLRRLVRALPVLWLVLTATFLCLRLYGQQALEFAPGANSLGSACPPTSPLFDVRAPLIAQYAQYMWHALRLDWTESCSYAGETTWEVVRDGFPVTATIGALAFLLGLLTGVPSGVLAALRARTLTDRLTATGSTVSYSVPPLVFGLGALMLVVDLQLPLPVLWDGRWQNYVLPSLVLGLSSAGFLVRLTRASVLEVLSEDYVRTARAKGLLGRVVLSRHVLRNALLPVVAFLGPTFAAQLAGSVLVEYVFDVPGTGHMLFDGFASGDYALILAGTTIYTALVVLANLLADVGYRLLDPQARTGA